MKRLKHGGRLRGKAIMLAAGIPGPEDKALETAAFGTWDIDQAVTALARAVFAEGGQLVVRGDAALTLLVAMVAGEYQTQRFAEGSGPDEAEVSASLRAYPTGPRSDRESVDEALVERLHLAHIEDSFSPGEPEAMRLHALIDREDPAALVCIGGGPDVMLQARTFADLAKHRPIFALKHTGGAAAGMANDLTLNVELADVAIILAVRNRARGRFDRETFATDVRRREVEENVVPYPIIMQSIVEKILGGGGMLLA